MTKLIRMLMMTKYPLMLMMTSYLLPLMMIKNCLLLMMTILMHLPHLHLQPLTFLLLLSSYQLQLLQFLVPSMTMQPWHESQSAWGNRSSTPDFRWSSRWSSWPPTRPTWRPTRCPARGEGASLISSFIVIITCDLFQKHLCLCTKRVINSHLLLPGTILLSTCTTYHVSRIMHHMCIVFCLLYIPYCILYL